jgi:hypothetical protein
VSLIPSDILKRFDRPDELRIFPKGRFEIVHAGGLTLGRASYEPGWKWSEHVGAAQGKRLCEVAHVGVVLAGEAVVALQDGRELRMRAGDVFEIATPHDSWVVGEEPYVSLHLAGAGVYGAHD